MESDAGDPHPEAGEVQGSLFIVVNVVIVTLNTASKTAGQT